MVRRDSNSRRDDLGGATLMRVGGVMAFGLAARFARGSRAADTHSFHRTRDIPDSQLS